MDKVRTILKREYLTRVRSKGFILGTILSPLLMAAFVIVPALIAGKQGGASRRIVVLDQTSDATLYESVRATLAGKEKKDKGAEDKNNPDEGDKPDRFDLRREAVSATQIETRKQELNREMGEGRLAAYLVVPEDVLDSGKIEYHAKNVSDFISRGRIEGAFNTAVIAQRMKHQGISPELAGRLSKDIDMEAINERGEKESGQSFALAFVLLIIIYITVLVYGMMVMRGVIEEKQSRIIEVLLSSARPYDLMMGKLFGIGLVGLTQYIIWAVCGILLSALAAMPALAFVSSFRMPKISVSLMVFFVVYFLLGYFLYASLYMIVGAIVSSEEDGQQLQLPVTMSIAGGFALMSVIIRNPDSVLSTVLSLIPFFGPVLMFLRITIQPPPWWQIALSIGLMLATIFGVVWLAAKIYRVGVLMYGKRPTLPELAKWLRYS
ncbi:MAG TPA: ABC transporter permease [Blastocatellia bacterium]|nr:ABC transporter permease [Blastocatellia bacterium]